MKNQSSFLKNPSLSHGGTSRKGLRKTARPLATKRAVHVVLKSSRAVGNWSLLRKKNQVEDAVYRTARHFHIRIRLYQNVGNHLHLAIQGRHRREIQNFFRVLPQLLVYLVTKTRKGSPIGRFWDAPLFTRVVNWGKDWLNVGAYFEKNRWESKGMPRDVVDLWFTLSKKPG